VGNPIAGTRRACGVSERKPVPSARRLDIRQANYPGGIQIWGSNPAFLWTSPKDEEEGIHVHAFLEGRTRPKLDDTYGEVVIDGVRLDAAMVRVLMAQNALPSLCDRVRSLDCPSCGESQFAVGRDAHTPTAAHACGKCAKPLIHANGGHKTVLNPLPAILERLAAHAPRPPQRHRID
jgi:ribosomal protein S27E